jgi:tRNA dimethylallyltransferase
MKNKFLVIIAGPTAVGKTDISIELAKVFKSPVISADSRQVYKEMTIGTAVPSREQLESVKHYFIQHISIKEKYNASVYETEAINLLDDLFITHDVLIMTGGSGLYINAVCHGIDFFPDTDTSIREDIRTKLKTEGIESLQKELAILDPQSYKTIDLQNPKRIQKALEISRMTGKPYSDFLTGIKKERDFNIIRICLDMDRNALYERINERVLLMLKQGLVEEAEKLYPLKHYNALNTVGYKELFDYFEGKSIYEEAIEKIQANSRKYARKQLTWFRKDKLYTFFNPTFKDKIIEEIKIQSNRL